MPTKRPGIDQRVYFIVIGVLLVLLAAMVILFTLGRRLPSASPAPQDVVEETFGNVEPFPSTNASAQLDDEKENVVLDNSTLSVSWRLLPVEMNMYEISTAAGLPYDDVSGYGTDYRTRYYKVGTVSGSGAYDGSPVILAVVPCYSMCFGEPQMHFIVDYANHRLLNLSAHGPSVTGTLIGKDELGPGQDVVVPPGRTAVDAPELRLAGLDVPDRLTVVGSNVVLTRSENQPPRFVLTTETVKVGETTDGRTLFADAAGNCLLVQLPDGTFVQYDMPISFLTDNRIPQITWSDGTANAADYTFADYGGCGATKCYAVRDASEVRQAARLVNAGRTSTGDTVYTLKDGRDAELLGVYDESTQYVPEGQSKPTYDQFIAKRPLFYWKDSFGRWIRFVRTDALPAVECGKPVIYLYPQKEMPVSVRVGLKGKMTVSEPPHGTTGWKVTARPDGYVVNAADGKTYPNLFWEGTGVGYRTPKQGFVVKTAEADAWLQTTLAKIGFTERESAEFREFWVPRLPTTPYTFITFVPQADFDRDAPLMISPRPDRVYRVFMEYRGLQTPISVEPLTLPKIERTGFTVVEWGGALKK